VRRPLARVCFYAALLLTLGIVSPGFSQSGPESNPQVSAAKDAENSEVNEKWHLINTAIFAVGLGYAIWKLAPAFFNARSADIQRAINEATGLKMQADMRYSEIDRQMATLPESVQKMREQSRIEMEREHARRKQDTARELQHIQSSVASEIDALRIEGARRIRRRTARLALQLAERRLRETSSEDASNGLFRDLIHLVERGKN
jgi:F-type H+-transporting ATPase subunit b